MHTRVRAAITRGLINVLVCVLVAAVSAHEPVASQRRSRSFPTAGRLSKLATRNGRPIPGPKAAATLPIRVNWDGTITPWGERACAWKRIALLQLPMVAEVGRPGRYRSVPQARHFCQGRRMTKAILDVQFIGRDGERTHGSVAYIGAERRRRPRCHTRLEVVPRSSVSPERLQQVTSRRRSVGPATSFRRYRGPIRQRSDRSHRAKRGPPRPHPDADVADVLSRNGKQGEDQGNALPDRPDGRATAPAEGYRLLVILPGGDGSTDFRPFVQRIAKHGLPPGYLIAARWP